MKAIVPPDTPGTLSASAMQNPLIKFSIYTLPPLKVINIKRTTDFIYNSFCIYTNSLFSFLYLILLFIKFII